MSLDDINTLLWKVDANCPDPEIIRQAGLILRRGGLVAFPTETVYGLGANALVGAAVEKIFIAKGRPQDNPLIVHVAGVDHVADYVQHVPLVARLLMKEFWPGPLTLVLPGNEKISKIVSAGLASIAFRMPDHPVALSLIKAAGVPVAAPSANLSGRPSPTAAEHVLGDLKGRVDVILDGGPCGMGVESTVLDITGSIPVILRPGGITPEQIKQVTGEVLLDDTLQKSGMPPVKPRSPGMKYRHYAPSAPLILIEGPEEEVVRQIQRLSDEYGQAGKKVGVLCREGSRGSYNGIFTVTAGIAGNPASVAADLYSALRCFEGAGVDIILAEGVEDRGLGLAVANRLRRAAGGKIISV